MEPLKLLPSLVSLLLVSVQLPFFWKKIRKRKNEERNKKIVEKKKRNSYSAFFGHENSNVFFAGIQYKVANFPSYTAASNGVFSKYDLYYVDAVSKATLKYSLPSKTSYQPTYVAFQFGNGKALVSGILVLVVALVAQFV